MLLIWLHLYIHELWRSVSISIFKPFLQIHSEIMHWVMQLITAYVYIYSVNDRVEYLGLYMPFVYMSLYQKWRNRRNGLQWKKISFLPKKRYNVWNILSFVNISYQYFEVIISKSSVFPVINMYWNNLCK
jgi:hypothetical protein